MISRSAKNTPALVLRRTNYGEADRILVLLTEKYGQISAFAKGARRSKSKLAGGLELCTLSDITWISSKKSDGLATITSARMRKFYQRILEDFELMREVFKLLSVVELITKYQTDSQVVFSLTIQFLEELDKKTVEDDLLISWFGLHLLEQAGQGILLEKPLNADKFSTQTKYRFDLQQMGFLEDLKGQILPNDIKFLRLINLAQSATVLKNVSGWSGDATVLKNIAISAVEQIQ